MSRNQEIIKGYLTARDEHSGTKNTTIDLRSHKRSQSNRRSRQNSQLVSSQSARRIVPLRSPSEISETRGEFIHTCREYLRKEISIKDKVDETSKLGEFLFNEQEKLQMSKTAFDIDKRNFLDYKLRLKEDVATIEKDVKNLIKIKAEKDERILRLKQQIHELNTNMFRIDENLETYKAHLRFIEDVYEFKGMQKMKQSGWLVVIIV